MKKHLLLLLACLIAPPLAADDTVFVEKSFGFRESDIKLLEPFIGKRADSSPINLGKQDIPLLLDVIRISDRRLDVVINNLINIETIGFKKTRLDTSKFLNLLVKGGAKPEDAFISSRETLFDQGSLQAGTSKLDAAVDGPGFFKVAAGNGTSVFTRSGNLRLNARSEITDMNGYPLVPRLVLPADFAPESISITPDGLVACRRPGSNVVVEAGRIHLYGFKNPAGLERSGNLYFMENAASGKAEMGKPGFGGLGRLRQGFLETANVNALEEYADLVTTNRLINYLKQVINKLDGRYVIFERDNVIDNDRFKELIKHMRPEQMNDFFFKFFEAIMAD